jgi:integrase
MSKVINFNRDTLRKLRNDGLPVGKKQVEYRDSKETGLCMIQYPTGKQMFYFMMSCRKQRFKERLGDSDTFTVQEARLWTNELRAAIYKGDNPIATRRQAEMLFPELFTLYYEEKKDKKASSNGDESKYRLHLAPVFATKQIGSITSAHIEKYHAKKKEELTPATANRHLALLKAMFTYAVNKLEVLTKSPASGIKAFPEPQKQRKYFDIHELNRFFTTLESEVNTEAANIIRFMVLCGTRSSATRDLRLENYDAKLGTILISLDKNGTGQYVSLSDKAKAILDHQIAKYGTRGRVFRGVDMQSRMSDPSRVMARVCKNAGLPTAGVHQLRHSYSFLALENGVSPYQLMTALNHKNLSSTMVYSSISNKKLRQINNDLASQLSF